MARRHGVSRASRTNRRSSRFLARSKRGYGEGCAAASMLPACGKNERTRQALQRPRSLGKPHDKPHEEAGLTSKGFHSDRCAFLYYSLAGPATGESVCRFLQSQAARDFVGFLLALNEAVRGKALSDPCPASPAVEALVQVRACCPCRLHLRPSSLRICTFLRLHAWLGCMAHRRPAVGGLVRLHA